MSQTLNVLYIQVSGRFVEGQYSTCNTERLSQREPDDERSENLLSGTAATPHVHGCTLSVHDHSVVVGLPLRYVHSLHTVFCGSDVVRTDLNIIDICNRVNQKLGQGKE